MCVRCVEIVLFVEWNDQETIMIKPILKADADAQSRLVPHVFENSEVGTLVKSEGRTQQRHLVSKV